GLDLWGKRSIIFSDALSNSPAKLLFAQTGAVDGDMEVAAAVIIGLALVRHHRHGPLMIIDLRSTRQIDQFRATLAHPCQPAGGIACATGKAGNAEDARSAKTACNAPTAAHATAEPAHQRSEDHVEDAVGRHGQSAVSDLVEGICGGVP